MENIKVSNGFEFNSTYLLLDIRYLIVITMAHFYTRKMNCYLIQIILIENKYFK